MNPWIHTVREHKPGSGLNLESVFTQANGRIGIRGYEEEGRSGEESDPMQFVAGYFDRSPVTRNTMVNIPTIRRFRIRLDGEILDPGIGRVSDFQRTLDLRCAVSERSFTWSSPHGSTTKIRFVSYLSHARPNLHLTEISIEPVDWSGAAEVEDVFDGTGLTQGQKHFDFSGHGDLENGHFCEIRTLTSRLGAVLASTWETPLALDCSESEMDGRIASRLMAFGVRRGRTARLRRYAAVVTDFEGGTGPLLARAKRCLAKARGVGWKGLRKEQDAAWKALWDAADVTIAGDPVREFKLRFSIFQMLQAYRPGDSRLSIGAKFLSGAHYSGHYFWDTDNFLTPFFLLTMPEAAQDLVGFRVRNIEGARIKARAMKFRGAFYPWEACPLDGRENCPEWWKDKALPEPVYIPCGKIELHINSAVALAASNYLNVSARPKPARREIHRMLVEIARFWASRGVWENGKFSIKNVIGPDEYHEFVDDNAYTNHTARWCLARALAIAKRSANDLGISKKEIAEWEKIVAGIELGDGGEILAQDRTFLGLGELDRSKFHPVTPLFRQIPMEEIAKLQAIKQADVLALFHQLPFSYDFALMRRCWDYYEPRTLHDSNLSAGSHAVVAALLRLPDEFLRYYDKVLNLDIGGESYNVTEGLHAANAGNAWSATIIGAAGIRWTDDSLICSPQLPAGWKSLGFRIVYRGRRLAFKITHKSLAIAFEKGRPVRLTAAGRALRVDAGAQTLTIPLDPLAVVFDIGGMLADGGTARPGVKQLLTRLKLAGLKLAACGDETARTHLGQAGLDRHYFDVIVEGDDPEKSLRLAARQLCVSPARCLHVASNPPARRSLQRTALAGLTPEKAFRLLDRLACGPA
jgi:trehalose/maltose hydrolase-like predicted phosphorylase